MLVNFDGKVVALPIKLRDILEFRGHILMESVPNPYPAGTGRSLLLRASQKKKS
jgi:hypothetical protein